MKTLTISTIILLAFISRGYAQNAFATSYVEKTHVSPKIGVLAGYQFASKHEVGVFYQREVDGPEGQDNIRPRFYEKEFFGINLGSQLFSFHRANMLMDVRIGLINKSNFSITPSLKLDYEFIKRFHLQGGVGVRSFNPTFQGGLKIDLY